MEMATHKIAVIAYAPGIVGMAMWDLINEKLGEMEGRKKGERVTRHAVDLTVMKRVSVLDDVAEEFRGRYWTTAVSLLDRPRCFLDPFHQKCEPE